MNIQKKIAKMIIDKGGDYILALKENHKTLYHDKVG
jgi:predicted transposase YbfD/YdcC